MNVNFQSVFVGFDASFGRFRPPSMCVQHYRSTRLIALGFFIDVFVCFGCKFCGFGPPQMCVDR